MTHENTKKPRQEKPLLKNEAKKDSHGRYRLEIQQVLSVALASTDDLIEGLELCLDACLVVSGMNCGGIYLFDDRGENLNLMVHKGLSTEFVSQIMTYPHDSENTALVRKGKPLYTLVRDIPVRLSEKQQSEGLRAFASVPIFDKTKVIGCINIASRLLEDISAPVRLGIETIAAQTGNAIGRLKASKALRDSEEHLRSLMLNAEKYVIYRLAVSNQSHLKLKVVFVSPSIVDLMGVVYPNKFETWFDNIHPDDRDRVVAAYLKGMETYNFNEIMRINHPYRKETQWIHAIAKGVSDGNYAIRYVNGMAFDITAQKLVENALIAKERELKIETQKLEEINTTLSVMLHQRERDKKELQSQVFSNIKKLIMPYISKLKQYGLQGANKDLVEVIEQNLHQIISPFSLKLSSDWFGLTPTEIIMADLIKQGKKTKEIAEIRQLSQKTVEQYRKNIRKKLGLTNKRINLESHLKSFR